MPLKCSDKKKSNPLIPLQGAALSGVRGDILGPLVPPSPHPMPQESGQHTASGRKVGKEGLRALPGSHDMPGFSDGAQVLWASQVTLMVKNLPAKAGDKRDAGSIPGLGRSPGGGHGNPLQCSCLEKESHGQRSLAGCSPCGLRET